MGGGMGGGHMGGMGMGMGGAHFGGMGGMHAGAMNFGGVNRGFYGGRSAFYRPGIAGRGLNGVRGFNGRTAVFHGHRGYWRHGHFFPFFGVGLWDYGYGYGGASCYSNCLAAGYGPGYCNAYSYNFCY